MTHHSVYARDWIFLKRCGFLTFAKNIAKNVSKCLSSKYNEKLRHCTKKSALDACKTALRRAVQKSRNDWLLVKSKLSKTSPQNNIETGTNMHDEEIHKENYLSLEKRQKSIDDLRLMH